MSDVGNKKLKNKKSKKCSAGQAASTENETVNIPFPFTFIKDSCSNFIRAKGSYKMQ